MNAIIFGASKGGPKALKFVKKRFPQIRVIGFADNDPAKQGNRLNRLPIHKPEDLPSLNVDMVIIGSCYVDEIQEQLLELGMKRDQIEPLNQVDLIMPPLRGPLPLLCLALVMIALGLLLVW